MLEGIAREMVFACGLDLGRCANILGGGKHEEWLRVDIAMGTSGRERRSAQPDETHDW